MSTSVPFPASQSAQAGDFVDDLKIDLPRNSTSSLAKDDTAANNSTSHQPSAHLHRRQGSFQAADKPSTAPASWHHHPRQPGPHSESYFPGTSTNVPKTPSSLSVRGHGRTHSNSSNAFSAHPTHLNIGAAPPNVDGASLQSAFGSAHHPAPNSLSLTHHPAMHGLGMGGGYSAGPPSPSTLTDVILGLHSTFYSCKRKPEEVKQMVSRYYESGAVFESPLLSAHGRNQIANQFIMAFALPGMDVQSELRDVICSDFEFDGTRAGIIDHTITVTLFPSLFGSSPAKPTPNPGASDANRTPRASYPMSASAYPMTPHPFIDYGASSVYSRVASRPHSPTTPFSISSIWGGSRPHTPGHAAATTGVRPLSGTSAHAINTPPSVNGEDLDANPSSSASAAANAFHHLTNGSNTHHYIDAEVLQQQLATRPAIPADALTPHWTSEGLGRQTLRTLIWSLFHPRAVLRSLCSIQLRVMSRLEFNDAGLIVRHEDTWGLRETIEGAIPFASLIYSIERRLVGFLVSWAIAKGFKISSSLLRKAIPGGASSTELEAHASSHQISQHEAEAMFTHPHMHQHALGRVPGREFQTISRSRAPSPTRFRFGGSDHRSSGATVTGTRSRARSLVGSHAPSRVMSTDNLMHHFATANAAALSSSGSGAEPRRSTDLPPDSSAKFRERSAKRIDGGRTTSTNSAPPTAFPSSASNAASLNGHDAIEFGANGPASNLVNMWEHFSAQSRPHSKAASVVSNDDSRTTLRAPDQDQQ
ncbi:uncharacterized protein UMAG_06189 [Mycosarcoma maydis]|uniref:Uncharacterized protein n=1 Tax=Mycosarcoma maydis TaxID=5270 RepID=A0A0D1DMQ1_MYCMD|nr:uncharacterized protein UMAG_06189 [Ustilago maydis 521]KIS65809.1 hypothetical protein UMAG_06189 [Ustilago maydis 521]|eukprot:XP_011392559.1 hypothetical protein UMAG_06189 [Ustilago maydis 521]